MFANPSSFVCDGSFWKFLLQYSATIDRSRWDNFWTFNAEGRWQTNIACELPVPCWSQLTDGFILTRQDPPFFHILLITELVTIDLKNYDSENRANCEGGGSWTLLLDECSAKQFWTLSNFWTNVSYFHLPSNLENDRAGSVEMWRPHSAQSCGVTLAELHCCQTYVSSSTFLIKAAYLFNSEFPAPEQ